MRYKKSKELIRIPNIMKLHKMWSDALFKDDSLKILIYTMGLRIFIDKDFNLKQKKEFDNNLEKMKIIFNNYYKCQSLKSYSKAKQKLGRLSRECIYLFISNLPKSTLLRKV